MDALKCIIEAYESKKLWMRNHEAVERNITDKEMYDFVRIAFKLIKEKNNGVLDYNNYGSRWLCIRPDSNNCIKIHLTYQTWLKFDCCGRLAWTSQEWKIGYERELFAEINQTFLTKIELLKQEKEKLQQELENKEGPHLIIDGFRKLIQETNLRTQNSML